MDPVQQASFWRPCLDSEGSKQPSEPGSSADSVGWKPEFSIPSSKGSEVWKLKPEESESEGNGLCNWKPSEETESEGTSSIWNWKPSSKPSSESKEPNFNITSSTYCHWDSAEPIEDSQRRFRQNVAQQFKKGYKFVEGRKACVWFHGNDSCVSTWDDFNCYDLVWVAVHGMDSICMVTWRKDVGMTRVGSFYQEYCTNQQALISLAEAVLSEVECLPYEGDERLGVKSDGCIDKPFCVVSVIPGTKHVHEESGNEASSDDNDQEKALNYFKEKVSSGSAFTKDETIQTAISVFQQLCLLELKAEHIWVSVLEVKHNFTLPLRLEQRRKHFDVIRGIVPSGNRAASASASSDGGDSASSTVNRRPRFFSESGGASS